MDEKTKATVAKLPLLTINAGPRDGDKWVQRLKEEYKSLIQVLKIRLLRLNSYTDL